MCDYYVKLLCAGKFGLGWAHDVFKFACHMFMHTYLQFSIFLYIDVVGAFMLVSLSPFLFLSVSCFMAPIWKSTLSQNPLHYGASSSFDTTSHVRFRDDKARKDFSENFSWRGIHSERQVILSDFFDTDFSTVIYNWGWESLCGILVTCPSVIIQEFYSNLHGFDTSIPQFVTCVRGMRIVVTPNLIFEVLHVPRVAHHDYLGCDRPRTVSKDELISLFYETPSSWGDHQNTLCSTFAKGPRFLNMVMTFILHPLSHYNTITELRARFLLSLLEDISIDFPSHFILSLIDVYRNIATCDKLIFPSAITRILHDFSW